MLCPKGFQILLFLFVAVKLVLLRMSELVCSLWNDYGVRNSIGIEVCLVPVLACFLLFLNRNIY